jgi:hypothetical protein
VIKSNMRKWANLAGKKRKATKPQGENQSTGAHGWPIFNSRPMKEEFTVKMRISVSKLMTQMMSFSQCNKPSGSITGNFSRSNNDQLLITLYYVISYSNARLFTCLPAEQTLSQKIKGLSQFLTPLPVNFGGVIQQTSAVPV